MHPLLVPTINNNDTDAKLLAWEKADGELVREGETIAVLETTKATFDFPAEHDGVLHQIGRVGEKYDYGVSIGLLFPDEAARQTWLAQRQTTTANTGGMIVTTPARELAQLHGITDAQLAALGKRVVKAADLAPLLPVAAEPADALAISEHQRGVARVVSRSHATIPASFILRRVNIETVLVTLAQFGREQRVMLGLPDLIVWTLARLPERFPFFFGEVREPLAFVPSRSGNIGVTFDLGHGLFIPVIREAARLSLKETAKAMMSLRMKAGRGEFKAADLTGGDISLSINSESDTVFVQPIIQPPQSCMISLGAILDGPPRHIHLGAAFDHRVINGSEASAFLGAIKTALEQPDAASWAG